MTTTTTPDRDALLAFVQGQATMRRDDARMFRNHPKHTQEAFAKIADDEAAQFEAIAALLDQRTDPPAEVFLVFFQKAESEEDLHLSTHATMEGAKAWARADAIENGHDDWTWDEPEAGLADGGGSQAGSEIILTDWTTGDDYGHYQIVRDTVIGAPVLVLGRVRISEAGQFVPDDAPVAGRAILGRSEPAGFAEHMGRMPCLPMESTPQFFSRQNQAAAARPERCPTCDSPRAHLHPAMQHEGEVQPCSDPWHTPVAVAFDDAPGTPVNVSAFVEGVHPVDAAFDAVSTAIENLTGGDVVDLKMEIMASDRLGLDNTVALLSIVDEPARQVQRGYVVRGVAPLTDVTKEHLVPVRFQQWPPADDDQAFDCGFD